MKTIKPALQLAAFAAVLISASGAWAASAPTGLWIDHTGRGGVEITKCGDRLCGHVAWLKDAKNSEACGVQVIGDAKSMRNGTWDRGWIYDPEAESKYDVELKPIGSNKLRVMGYAGTKFLSETMIWKRAPVGLTKCSKDGSEIAAVDVSDKPVKTSQSANMEAKPTSEKPKVKTAILTPKAKSRTASPQKAKTPKTAKTNDKSKRSRGKIAQALVDMNESRGKGNSRSGSKRNCRYSVPYLKMVVKVPCDG
jgi:uncharacterized protein (DUF2147 family)